MPVVYAEMVRQIDDIDFQLLRLLQEDADRSTAEVASIAEISPSHCARRIKKLKANGYIKEVVATLDREKLAFPTQFFVQVKLDQRSLAAFIEKVKVCPEVVGCYAVLGAYDFLLRVISRDLRSYEEFYFHTLTRLPGVRELTTCTSVAEIKMTTELPLAQSPAKPATVRAAPRAKAPSQAVVTELPVQNPQPRPAILRAAARRG